MKKKQRNRTFSGSPRAARGFALLLTLMTLMVIAIIVAQVAARVRIESQRVDVRVRERQCRRAMDSTIGLAVRLLSESTEDLRVDHLGDEWTRAKTFDIGDATVDISIIDCERLFDLKILLEEEAETLEENKEVFVAFAQHCGLDSIVAQRLADAIAAEAEVRRLEDATETEEETTETTTGTSGNATGSGTTTTETSVPIWLEDFLSLPQLTDDDRLAIASAHFVHQDPETLEETDVQFLDLLTIWQYDAKVNVNTASREVIMYSLPELIDMDTQVDAIIEARDEEPLLNTSQIRSIATLNSDQTTEVTQHCRLSSRRFRVTATATMKDMAGLPQVRQGRMVVILDRSGNNEFTVLWRSSNL